MNMKVDRHRMNYVIELTDDRHGWKKVRTVPHISRIRIIKLFCINCLQRQNIYDQHRLSGHGILTISIFNLIIYELYLCDSKATRKLFTGPSIKGLRCRQIDSAD